MSVLRRALPFACLLALLVPVLTASASPSAPGTAAKKVKAKKKCPKGYKPKTVTKKGKKVKVCRKVKVDPVGPGPGPGPVSPKGIFEAPGQKLEGEAAKPFLQKYLVNSRFTDCPAEWPNCAVEQRYSHTADNTFYYCRLTSSSGSDIRVTDEYAVEGAVVEPDGSWTFREVVYNSGNYSHYEWHVSTAGVVNGAYQFTPSSAIEQLGPFQYVPGARSCSY